MMDAVEIAFARTFWHAISTQKKYLEALVLVAGA
jgi:hypothetical protein